MKETSSSTSATAHRSSLGLSPFSISLPMACFRFRSALESTPAGSLPTVAIHMLSMSLACIRSSDCKLWLMVHLSSEAKCLGFP